MLAVRSSVSLNIINSLQTFTYFWEIQFLLSVHYESSARSWFAHLSLSQHRDWTQGETAGLQNQENNFYNTCQVEQNLFLCV